ncbi:Spo0B domain-containing protein [Alicyclobacillus sp. SP_1]|uniref:Spo0B domain-containing protein n=1 Tax=Alicyclobacillus sp. SP_1 TaxID=2942475 RepID=UPI0021572F1A|nr:Spo0B domain-containing protein [Alicyclobacillus sp. SP_1]
MNDSEDIWKSLDLHRHEVLNALQLIRAYGQLGKTESQLAQVDRLAEWIHSLSLWNREWIKHSKHCLLLVMTDRRIHLSNVDTVDSMSAEDSRVLAAFLSGLTQLLSVIEWTSVHLAIVHRSVGEPWQIYLDGSSGSILHIERLRDLCVAHSTRNVTFLMRIESNAQTGG